MRFETAPDLVSGIDLIASGQKVGWSIDGYLASLEDGIRDLLKEKEGAEAKAQSERDGKPAPKPEGAKSRAEPTPVPISEGPELGAKNR